MILIGVDDRVEYTRTESRYDISDFSSHASDSKDDQTFQNDLLHTVFSHCAKGVSSIPQPISNNQTINHRARVFLPNTSNARQPIRLLDHIVSHPSREPFPADLIASSPFSLSSSLLDSKMASPLVS